MAPNHEAGVVVCPEPLAAAAGGRILERGGSAVDAAVAAGFAQGVVNPLMCGIGGTARMLVYHAPEQKLELINFGSRAPSKAGPNTYRYIGRSVFANDYNVEGYENYVGYKAVTIPSFVRIMWNAHARFGRLPWSDLLQPAIELAANGFEVYPYIYQFWDPNPTYLSDGPPAHIRLRGTEEAARIYLRDGQVLEIGQVLKQEDYARTLERLADRGADVFYHGEIAHAIADDFERNGGLLTLQDLEGCASVIEQPTKGSYRGYDVVSDTPPGNGPVIIEALNILEHLDLQSLGWQSPRYLDVLARVFQSVLGDKARWMADPRFEDIPIDKFLSKERAAEIARCIEKGMRPQLPEMQGSQSNTTHVSVLDAGGNAVALMHSNGDASGVVTRGLGFLYNNHMENFDPRPGRRNSIQPGKTAIYGASPTMYLRGGALSIISGSLNRFRITGELQALVGMVDFGQDAQRAVSYPRIHAEYDPDILYVEPTVSPEVVSALEGFGWKPKTTTMPSPLCMILIDEKKQARAVIDPRGGGGHWPP